MAYSDVYPEIFFPAELSPTPEFDRVQIGAIIYLQEPIIVRATWLK